jgi:hypothetical protein
LPLADGRVLVLLAARCCHQAELGSDSIFIVLSRPTLQQNDENRV